MTNAAEFVKKYSGGGRAFLSAKILAGNKGLQGKIAELPYAETVQFSGEEEKEIYRIPIDLDQPVEIKGTKGSSDRTDMLWSPGSNALGFLLDQLGQDEESWVGTKGQFEQRIIGSTAAWFFVPLTSKSSTTSRSKGSSTKSAKFSCGMCNATFTTLSDLQSHQSTKHS